MAATLAQLIVPLQTADVVSQTLAILQLAGFPTNSWASTSVPTRLINAFATVIASVSQTIANIANGGYLALAATLAPAGGTSSWVDLNGSNFYSLTRNPATSTQGQIFLSDTGSVGPLTFVVGQLWAVSTSGLRYNTTSGGTLPLNGNLVLNVVAETADSAHNVANNSITSLATPIPGVTVNNPAIGSTGTWITQQGTDIESDLAYIARCTGRWSTLGVGMVAAAYQYWAQTNAAAVTRVLVQENTPSGGQISLVLAGTAGPASGADVTTVQNYFNSTAGHPICIAVTVSAAAANNITITGTVTVKAANLAGAQAAFTTALVGYTAALLIGDVVRASKIVELLMDQTGVTNAAGIALSGGSPDVALGATQVATFTNSLTWVTV